MYKMITGTVLLDPEEWKAVQRLHKHYKELMGYYRARNLGDGDPKTLADTEKATSFIEKGGN